MNNNNLCTKEDLYKNLETINSWINNVDTKISFALTFASVILGYILLNGMPKAFNKFFIITKLEELNGGDILSVLLIIVLYVCNLLSIIFFLFGLRSKTNNASSSNSNIFFGTISKRSYIEFKRDISNMKEKELKNQIKEQIFINSGICNKKFQNYTKGINLLIVSFVLCFVCIIFQML